MHAASTEDATSTAYISQVSMPVKALGIKCLAQRVITSLFFNVNTFLPSIFYAIADTVIYTHTMMNDAMSRLGLPLYRTMSSQGDRW